MKIEEIETNFIVTEGVLRWGGGKFERECFELLLVASIFHFDR